MALLTQPRELALPSALRPSPGATPFVHLGLSCFNRRAAPLQTPAAGRNRTLCVVNSASRPQPPAKDAAPTEKLASKAWEVPAWVKNAAKGAAVAGLAVALMLSSVAPAEAARSGGRVGGSRFSASRSYSAPSSSYSSRSYSSPGASSYGPMRVAPSVGMGVGVNSFFFPMPFGYGYGYPAPVAVGGGGGIFTLMFTIFAAYIIFSVATNYLGGDEGYAVGGERVAVGKLQVALLGSARTLQRDLDRIAARADTESAEGLHYVLQETVIALQRNPDYWCYGSSSLSNERGFDEAEAKFNELSLEQRSKFRSETLSNVGGRTGTKSFKREGDGDSELIVVTILVAAETSLKLPKITGGDDLRVALNRIGAVPEQSIVAVEVLWTPQDPSDYYTRDEVMTDFPDLAIL